MKNKISDAEFSSLVQKMKDHYTPSVNVADLAEKIVKDNYSDKGFTKDEIDTLVFQLVYAYIG